MDFSKSIGDYYLFSADQICLSVGETCGLPRANTVRPYRALGNLPYENLRFVSAFLVTRGGIGLVKMPPASSEAIGQGRL